MLVVYVYVALAAYNVECLTRDLGNIESVVDDAANIAAVDFEAVPGKEVPVVAAVVKSRSRSRSKSRVAAAAGESVISPLDIGVDRRREVYEAKLSAKRTGRGRAESCSEKWKGTGVLESTGGVRDWKALWGRGTDAVMDIPVGGVCEVLYGDGREREDFELGLDDEALYSLENAKGLGAW